MRGNSKQAIVDAAISLFNTKGYSGTSIRDIAKKANVNIANIAYYFENKQGLLEYCLTTFFEHYIKEIEAALCNLDNGATLCIKEVARNILKYQFNHFALTRFVLREMSIDSQIIRELMSTYLAVEKFHFKKILEKGMKNGEFQQKPHHLFIIQFKGLMSMPFLNSHYTSEVLHVVTNENFFIEQYLQEIMMWIDQSLCSEPFRFFKAPVPHPLIV